MKLRTAEKPGLLMFCVLLSFIPFHHVLSQDLDSLLNNKRSYYATHTGELPNPKIDGLLGDTIWHLGEWQGNFTQQQPYGGRPPSETTWIKILYDHSSLFVAIACKDGQPDKVRDILDRRDAISGDMTGIAIDSYYDRKTAFEFNLSAAGQKMDLKHLGDYQWDFNWDAVWDGATSRNDSGWIAEMRIPFSQLRYTGQEEHTWGMHVWRWIERKQEEDQWQYIPLEAPAMVYLFGELKGIRNIRESRQVELLPYVLGSYESGINDVSEPFGYNAGLNAKIGIRSDYTIDLAVNPDFGQVEADPSVLNLSSFETFFDEKRPFFLEGNDIFDFALGDDIPYYSRRIGSIPDVSLGNIEGSIEEFPGQNRIISAVKLTGKSQEGLSIGLVNGLTAREFGLTSDISGSEEKLEVAPLSNYMASRVKKEFKDGNSSMGGFFSMVNRFTENEQVLEHLPSEAYTGGVDLLHHWKNRNYFIELKTLASQLRGTETSILEKQLSHNHRFQRPDATHLEADPDATRLSGSGGMVRAGKKGGNWNYSLEGQYRSPGLNLNDMGYIGQSDYFGEKVELSYDMNEPRKWIRNYSINLIQEGQWSFGGERTMNMLGNHFIITHRKLWTLAMNVQYHFSFLDTRELRGGPALRNDSRYGTGFYLRSNSSKNLYGSLHMYHFGSPVVDYLFNYGELSLTWLPLRQVRLSSILHMNHLEYYQQYVRNMVTSTSLESIVADIDRKTTSFTLRAELFINPEISLQYYGNPYFTSGKYESFKRVADPSATDHDERHELLETTWIPDQNRYEFDLNGENMELSNPDFSFLQYRSNVVFRWEYNPGSTLYLVWSHDRSDYQREYNPIDGFMGDMFGLRGNNVFMVKFNYWFSL